MSSEKDLKPGDTVWIYELPRHKVIPDQVVQLTVDVDGIVKSVSVMGRRWDGARTRRGIRLGDSFRQVMRWYGAPDEVEHYDSQVEAVAQYVTTVIRQPGRDEVYRTYVSAPDASKADAGQVLYYREDNNVAFALNKDLKVISIMITAPQ